MFVSLLYTYKLHTRKNNSYGIIVCLSFYLNCCTLSFPLNMFMFWQFKLNIKLLAICEIK